ncbi:MAG: deoxyhypusine synthase [Deltaproteobacteria bacterium]|nr:MAG: deoxyhypusine synthase [Deltaproteobacteria bacterium]
MSNDRPKRGQATDDPAVRRELRDGLSDGLLPLQTLDVAGAADVDELLRGMSLTAFGGRRMGEAADVLYEMITDPECSVVLTLSGAMTVAKMGLLITEMIERGWVQAVVSTGALMTHGLVELAGLGHFKAAPGVSDDELFRKGYLRVYDTYELEANLNDLERILHHEVFPRLVPGERFGSRHLCRLIGEALAKPGVRGIMASAWRAGVPIYIPAFTDSELGLDVATWYLGRKLEAEGRDTVKSALLELRSDFDPFLDLGHFARIVTDSPHMGIFTIGGGVPRNWAQQAPPFIDIMNTALNKNAPFNRYRYGVRICPEPVHWGGLSGCTYTEGVSWGKFIPESEGGRYAEVHTDATIAWPLVVKAVMQRLDKTGAEVRAPSLDLPGCQPAP